MVRVSGSGGRSIVVAAMAATAVTAGAVPAQAGFLEMIFGGSQPRREIQQPLEMTIRPDRPARPSERKYDASADIPHVKVVSIDPIAHPNWYLIDPTLRPGDIVVLPKKVLVYTSRRVSTQIADFDELKGTRMLSARDRERVRLLTEYSRGPAVKYTIISAPEMAQPAGEESAQKGAPARSIMIDMAADKSG